jgi:N-acetyl-gamma-glutamyl-phosphate reductase
VGVLGASGYAGRELVALIQQHPQLELAFAAAQSRAGETVRIGRETVRFIASDDAPLAESALVFSALPHGASAAWSARAQAAGAKVVDLSHDLRPGHPVPEVLADVDAPYGLPEINRDAVRTASIVANPGCYPTGAILGLMPLVTRELLAADAPIIINAASGVSGAGNSPRADLLFGEVAEDFRAYGVGNSHRHLIELRATLQAYGGAQDVLFTPHLLPVMRGILSTITVTLREPLADPLALYRTHYAVEPFVEVCDAPPTLREVAHRNVVRVFVTPVQQMRAPVLQIITAIDNLVKGAAGQAVQNANLMLGLDEVAGLPA